MKMVPTMAISRMVPRLLKKSLFGMKYPASSTIGGSMNRKKMFGVRVVSGICPAVKKTMMPTTMPRMIKRHDSRTGIALT